MNHSVPAAQTPAAQTPAAEVPATPPLASLTVELVVAALADGQDACDDLAKRYPLRDLLAVLAAVDAAGLAGACWCGNTDAEVHLDPYAFEINDEVSFAPMCAEHLEFLAEQI